MIKLGTTSLHGVNAAIAASFASWPRVMAARHGRAGNVSGVNLEMSDLGRQVHVSAESRLGIYRAVCRPSSRSVE